MTAEQIAFREIVLRHASGWFPRSFTAVCEAVNEEWGSVLERRIARVLSALVRGGQIERHDGGYRLPPRLRRSA